MRSLAKSTAAVLEGPFLPARGESSQRGRGVTVRRVALRSIGSFGGEPAMDMTAEEIDQFLNRTQPALLGVLGTLDSAGYPTTLPVWYRYDGALVTIWTTFERAWPKHIARHPKVSLAVMETEPPFAAVLIKGTASIVVDGEGHWDEVKAICERYIVADEVDDYVASWSMLEAMCVISPDRFITWKRGY